jgi:hypothetical protein
MTGSTMANNKSMNRKSKITTLELPALEIRQGKNRRLYSFAVDGKKLHDFCTVSRVSRHDGEGLSGYQRPEVVSHITQIKDYLESENPLLPNAIVVAFNPTVQFRPAAGSKPGISRMGTLVIPVDPECPDSDKPGWIGRPPYVTLALTRFPFASSALLRTATRSSDSSLFLSTQPSRYRRA